MRFPLIAALALIPLVACGDEDWRLADVDAGDHCVSLSIGDCKAAAQCEVLRFYPWNETDDCWGTEREDVGCIQVFTSCDQAMTCAEDPNGTPWFAPSSCLPAAWSNGECNKSAPNCE